jgi:hemolysin III
LTTNDIQIMNLSLDLKREQLKGQTIANSISHGAGLIAAIIGAPVLILNALRHGETAYIVSTSIFSFSMVILYLSSTIYHALPRGGAKRWFRIIEHSAIYVLIAGTYTPLTLGVLHGAFGWTLFGIVWGLALIGITLKAIFKTSHPIISTAFYLVMGWLALIAVGPLFTRMPAVGLIYLIVGGLCYTVGVAFFAADSRLRYGHLIWHLFVIAGTACHYVMILNYAA